MKSAWRQVETATTDALGNISFAIPGPAGSDMTLVTTLAVINASHAGDFLATVDSGDVFGPWSGAQPFGYYVAQANLAFTVTGTGLLPKTQYTLQMVGFLDTVANVENLVLPVPTGSTALIGTDKIVLDKGRVIANGLGGSVQYGPFACSDYSTLRFGMVVTNGGPLDLQISYSDLQNQIAGALFLGFREFILPASPNSNLGYSMPHQGEQVTLVVTNTSGATATHSIYVEQSTHPMQAWAGEDIYIAPGASISHTVGAPGVQQLNPQWVFGGPAHLEFDPGALALNYMLFLQAQNANGSWSTIFQHGTADDLATATIAENSTAVAAPATTATVVLAAAPAGSFYRIRSVSMVFTAPVVAGSVFAWTNTAGSQFAEDAVDAAIDRGYSHTGLDLYNVTGVKINNQVATAGTATIAADLITPAARRGFDLIVPARPLRLMVQNTGAVDAAFGFASLGYDLHRVG